MVGVLESKQVGGLVYVVSVHEEVLALLYHERMDVSDGCTACRFVNHITKISGRIGKLVRAVSDRWHAKVQLLGIEIVLAKQVVEPFQYV